MAFTLTRIGRFVVDDEQQPGDGRTREVRGVLLESDDVEDIRAAAQLFGDPVKLDGAKG